MSASPNARLLDAKVAEAIGSGDLRGARALAVTPEHWRMIAEAEQQLRRPVTGKTDADLRAEAKNSRECESAQWSYDLAASANSSKRATVEAARSKMYSACGMNEPNNEDNRTVIINNGTYRRK